MSDPTGDIELIERRVGDCGCPEECYLVRGIDLVVHFEPDGTADAFMDGGDWGEAEASFWAPSVDMARKTVLSWAAVKVGL